MLLLLLLDVIVSVIVAVAGAGIRRIHISQLACVHVKLNELLVRKIVNKLCERFFFSSFLDCRVVCRYSFNIKKERSIFVSRSACHNCSSKCASVDFQ